MPARILDGKALAQRLRGELKDEAADLARRGVEPNLQVVLVGDDPASAVYVGGKQRACQEVGMRGFDHRLPADAAHEDVEALLRDLNDDPQVSGILLQLPTPPQVDGGALTSLIAPAKDVDGLTPANAGLLVQSREDAMVPCTPAGVMELLAEAGTELSGARAVILGRSILVGKPLAQLLLAANATVTQCHSHTRDLAGISRQAEVLVAAVGFPRLVNAEMVRQGATVIDVGTNRTDGGLVGDVDFDSVREVAGAITPVPGGVGPMTRAMLLANTVRAARLQRASAVQG